MKMQRMCAAKLFQSNMMKTRTIPNEELIPEFGRLVQEGAEVVFRPKGMSMLPIRVKVVRVAMLPSFIAGMAVTIVSIKLTA